MQKRLVAALMVLCLALATGLVVAQERFGGLTGLVTDASGAHWIAWSGSKGTFVARRG